MALFQKGYKVLIHDESTCRQIATEARLWLAPRALLHCNDIPKTIAQTYTSRGVTFYRLREGREIIRYDFPESMIKCICQRKRLRLIGQKT